jgi:hypothetical protein
MAGSNKKNLRYYGIFYMEEERVYKSHIRPLSSGSPKYCSANIQQYREANIYQYRLANIQEYREVVIHQ